MNFIEAVKLLNNKEAKLISLDLPEWKDYVILKDVYGDNYLFYYALRVEPAFNYDHHINCVMSVMDDKAISIDDILSDKWIVVKK